MSSFDSANKVGTKRAAPPHAFKKGSSGNPNGRPKRTQEELDLIQACRDKTPQALDTIERIMTEGENERNRLHAALSIIERAYGKAVQPTTVDATLTVLDDEQRRQRIRELQDKLAHE